MSNRHKDNKYFIYNIKKIFTFAKPQISLMPSPIENALDILIEAKHKALGEIAALPELQNVAIRLESGLSNLISNLSFLVNRSYTTAPQTHFPPVTEFMGDPIATAPEVTLLDITPTLDEKELFLAKVQALQETIRGREPETLIQDFSRPADVLVLRKVAKNAGLEDYEEGTINIDFVERIKAGLDAIDERAKEEDLIEQQLTNPLAPKVGEGGVSEVITVTPDDQTTMRITKAAKTKAVKEV